MSRRPCERARSNPKPAAGKTRMTNVRIAAVADLHFSKSSRGRHFTPWWPRLEARPTCSSCAETHAPRTCLRSRHACRGAGAAPHPDAGGAREPRLSLRRARADQGLLSDAGVHILDGESIEIHGIGFAGVKGFAGGFGRRVLEPWGEEIVKRFVHESVDEALKLETALARLKVMHRIVAVFHYSPIFRHRGGRAAQDLSRLLGSEPARGADQPLSSDRGVPRARAPRPSRRTDERRNPRVQRLAGRRRAGRRPIARFGSSRFRAVIRRKEAPPPSSREPGVPMAELRSPEPLGRVRTRVFSRAATRPSTSVRIRWRS